MMAGDSKPRNARFLIGCVVVALATLSACSNEQPESAEPTTSDSELSQDVDVAEGPLATSADTTASPTSDVVTIEDNGDETWAVVLAGASSQYDPLLEETVELANQAGYEATITNCDQGAAEAIGMSLGGAYTVSIYAADEQAAANIVDGLEEFDIVGVATEVAVNCN